MYMMKIIDYKLIIGNYWEERVFDMHDCVKNSEQLSIIMYILIYECLWLLVKMDDALHVQNHAKYAKTWNEKAARPRPERMVWRMQC